MKDSPDTPPEREYVWVGGQWWPVPADEAEKTARLWAAEQSILDFAAHYDERYGLHPDLYDNLEKAAFKDPGERGEWEEALADFFEAVAEAQKEEG